MAPGERQGGIVASLAAIAAVYAIVMPGGGNAADDTSLWSVYEQSLKGAKYVDLTHTITPHIPVWAGFAESTFAPAKAGADIEGFATKGEIFTYAKHGFEATEYNLKTDQLGTRSTRRPIGRPNILRSTSCLRPMPSGPSWSSPSSSN